MLFTHFLLWPASLLSNSLCILNTFRSFPLFLSLTQYNPLRLSPPLRTHTHLSSPILSARPFLSIHLHLILPFHLFSRMSFHSTLDLGIKPLDFPLTPVATPCQEVAEFDFSQPQPDGSFTMGSLLEPVTVSHSKICLEKDPISPPISPDTSPVLRPVSVPVVPSTEHLDYSDITQRTLTLNREKIQREVKLWTREAIAHDILDGHLLLVYDFKVYKVNNWIVTHPGGKQLLLHFIGRDATDQINVSHAKSTIKLLKAFCVGELADARAGSYRSLLPPSMLGFHPAAGTMGKGKLVRWVQEGETRAFLEGRERQGLLDLDESNRITRQLSPKPLLNYFDLFPVVIQPFTEDEAQASQNFKELTTIIDESGLMASPPFLSGYSVEIVRYLVCATISLACWWAATNYAGAWNHGWRIWVATWGSAVGLGVYWHLVSFTAHDIGHRSVANGSFFWNNFLGVILSCFTGGLSLDWWCAEHNIHHHMTNDVEHDPDVQQLPFLCLNEASLGSLWSTRYKEYKMFDKLAALAVRVQHLSYYCLLSVGRFNLCILSYQHLAIYAKRSKMWVFELVCLTGFFYWFGGVVIASFPSWKLRAFFLVVSFMTASPLHLQIVQSHYSRSMEDKGVLESHMNHNLRTTMDILIHPALRFYFGGLEHQTTHHLFPRMPRHNLKAATVIVKEWCTSHGYSFDAYGFVEGNKMTLSVMKSIADQVAFMGIVAADSVDEMTKKGVVQAFMP